MQNVVNSPSNFKDCFVSLFLVTSYIMICAIKDMCNRIKNDLKTYIFSYGKRSIT